MLGRILGGIELIGLIGLIMYITKVEIQEGLFLYLMYGMVIFPLIFIILLSCIRYKKRRKNER